MLVTSYKITDAKRCSADYNLRTVPSYSLKLQKSDLDTVSFGKKKVNVEEIALAYIKKNPPPENILNIGVHGSSSKSPPKPYSDIDLYCLCKNYDEKSIIYASKFCKNMGKKSNHWSEIMVGHLDNNDAFMLSPFELKDIKKNSVNVYGEGLNSNIDTMLKNYEGPNPTEILFSQLTSSGHRIKRIIGDFNKFQFLISKPSFEPKFIKKAGKTTAKEIKARTIAKQILTSCAFSNAIMDEINGNEIEFSKMKAPERFKEYFKYETDLPEISRKIYMGKIKGIDLKEFSTYSALEWLKIQSKLEKELLSAIRMIR